MVFILRYKERLQAKYKRPTNSKDWKPKLSSSSWTFVKDGLDDFRDGRPPSLENEDILIKVSVCTIMPMFTSLITLSLNNLNRT